MFSSLIIARFRLTNVENGLDVNAEKKNKYVVMSRDQNAGRSHNMKIDNSYVEREWNSSNVWEHT
jgi:hypothetical protein